MKSQIGFEDYITLIPNEKERIPLTKFRLSNHQLMIEKGRHMNLAREQRFCPFCKNSIEDEIHFLIECKTYEEKRERLLIDIQRDNSDFLSKNNLEKGKFLLSNKSVARITSRFVNECTLLRNDILKNM